MPKKILFIDRDGTLIDEPKDQQVDSLAKFSLKKNVIPALLQLQVAGYSFVMVTNQDGLGTAQFKLEDFAAPQQFLLDILQSQGIIFDAILICPHFEVDACECRKPKLGLVRHYLQNGILAEDQSYVIGDRLTDLELAGNMGIKAIFYEASTDWLSIAKELTQQSRRAEIKRTTAETDIQIAVDLDQPSQTIINTGIGFFDHMLEQLAKHSGIGMAINVKGDLEIDEHHTVEDTALALGEALRKALGDKLGINRYGFLLPMDEARAEVALDLSGRRYFVFEGCFKREKIGELPTELVPHFFRSLADSLGAAIHIKVIGENEHHMIESIFKGVGRTLRQAIHKQGYDLPSTKGVL